MTRRPPDRQKLQPGLRIARHRHDEAYAAVVLAGGYAEAGESGRRRLAAGDVVIHPMFSGHLNQVAGSGAVVLNVPVAGLAAAFGRLDDPDAVVRAAETDPRAAASMILEMLSPLDAERLDWPDDLAAALVDAPGLSLGAWARERRLAPETVSRGFARVFGVTPKRFRFEARARQALQAAMASDAPLAHVALDAGFADQAHMGHAVRELTGASPGLWRRRSSGDKTPG